MEEQMMLIQVALYIVALGGLFYSLAFFWRELNRNGLSVPLWLLTLAGVSASTLLILFVLNPLSYGVALPISALVLCVVLIVIGRYEKRAYAGEILRYARKNAELHLELAEEKEGKLCR